MTKDDQAVWVRLPLERAYNVRELGGLPTEAGGPTLWRAFLRADDLSMLTGENVRFLLNYGVGTVIDLRCESERREFPNRLGEENGVATVHIPFMKEEDLSPAALEQSKTASMGDLYVELLRRGDVVRALFEAIAGAGPGCVLFHCAVGKDRTGVLAMLLLMLAGVDKRDCVNNYCQSYQNLLRNAAFLTPSDEAGSHPLHESKAEYILKAYDYVGKAGGIVAYLEGCGLSRETLERVKARLVGDR